MRNALIALGVVVLIGAAFWGGTMYANAGGSDSTVLARGAAADGTMPAGGPMGNMTEDQIAAMDGMTQEERTAYLEEQGIDMPAGANGAAGGAPGGMRGGQLEGEVLDATSEMLTISLDSGSQTVYLDDDTVMAYAEDAAKLAAGSQIIVLADPATDGVTLATLVVVK